MTAAKFVTAIREITPDESKFTKMPEGFAQIYLDELFIGNKSILTNVEPENAIIDLTSNYDVSKLTIMIFSFNKSNELKETEPYTFFSDGERLFRLQFIKLPGRL